MSIQLIRQYHSQVDKIIRYGGSRNESALRKPFQDLLEHYARSRNLEMIAELDVRTQFGTLVYPDGTLKDALRQDWGYWESKDEQDDLEAEIAAKLAKGYPSSNILFEDTRRAVLYQAGREVVRVDFRDDAGLDQLLTRFVSYESREVRQFREAIEQFSQEVPALAQELREIIEAQSAQNAAFRQAAESFLELGRKAINPAVEMADVREMIIQHVLTQDIFTKIFDDPQFHQENNIAHRLAEVVNTFYHGATRHQINDRLGHYYATINARAAQIHNHQEKQKFLKALYENFYKAYNPKGADRLGIVYTPNEIVRFMIEATDHLLFKHFGKTLGDPGVDILDPATGTGTFITELIEYLPPHQLEAKYQTEIHCNEVAILPYYIANLNIEYTYRQKMGRYQPFENIVFVDTLDNMGFQYHTKQLDLFSLADENVERIDRQNERDISVIIGNPPYNAWQENFNAQNPNRLYKEIDRRIKDTYIKHGTAQNQIAIYDMYTRFYRWATDRLGAKGIIAFISNSSFIDAQTYDGFRKVVADEFDYIYLIDLGGNVR
jgi:predicted helicase